MSRPSPLPRWFTAFEDGHSEWYVRRFATLAADGADLDGEARFVDTLLGRGSRILDAGCGPGRVGAALQQRGHTVVGVDVDEVLIEAARRDHPGPTWVVADLTVLELPHEEPFDAVVLAGNVMVFLAPGTEHEVLCRLAGLVRPDGVVVTGFDTGHPYSLEQFDQDCARAGLRLEQRFATWDLRPWTEHSDWAVTVLRRPG